MSSNYLNLSKWGENYRVPSDKRVHMDRFATDDKRAFSGSKDEGKAQLEKVNERLGELQDLLFAEQKHKLLIILQAMDTAGKDGTIKTAFAGFNPSGIRVVSYKKPSEEELSHDYLWRIHQNTPKTGEIVVFNRSQYEDILPVRVHNLVEKNVWEKRYGHINDFERMLTDEGTTILKFFLNVSKDKQKERIEERVKDPTKKWKFRAADVVERKFWKQYMAAYEEILSKTSTDYAPWHVIPADTNWYRNLAVASITANTLEGFCMKYPVGDKIPKEFTFE